MDWLYLNLKYFTADQQSSIIQNIDEDAFSSLDSDTQSNIKYLFTQIHSGIPKKTLDTFYKTVLKTVLKKEKLYLEIVNEGESFYINVEKDAGEYNDQNILVRDYLTGQSLTPLDQAPVSVGIDRMLVNDLKLNEGEFYKLNILLEVPDSGQASGDAQTLVGELWLVVESDIDTDGT